MTMKPAPLRGSRLHRDVDLWKAADQLRVRGMRGAGARWAPHKNDSFAGFDFIGDTAEWTGLRSGHSADCMCGRFAEPAAGQRRPNRRAHAAGGTWSVGFKPMQYMHL